MDFSGLVVAAKGLENGRVVEHLLEHLRGRLDEVAFDIESALLGPLALAAQDVMHEVAELMEEDDDFAVLHQAGIAGLSAGEVADQHAFGKLVAADAGNDGPGGEPLVLAFARMHVEVDAAEELALAALGGVVDVEGVDRGVPDDRVVDRA